MVHLGHGLWRLGSFVKYTSRVAYAHKLQDGVMAKHLSSQLALMLVRSGHRYLG